MCAAEFQHFPWAWEVVDVRGGRELRGVAWGPWEVVDARGWRELCGVARGPWEVVDVRGRRELCGVAWGPWVHWGELRRLNRLAWGRG